MVRKLALIVTLLALFCPAVLMAQDEPKFDSLKDCMMCIKMNKEKAAQAMEAGDMTKVAEAAGMMKKATMCMSKNYSKGEDFDACCKMFCEAVENLEKAAKEGNKQAAMEAMDTAKKGCMGCHEKCRK